MSNLYTLVLLFVEYVSDKYASDPNGLIEVPPGGSFTDTVALRGDKDIGEKINIIIAKLAEANDLKGVIDVADVNEPDKLGSGKDMIDRLSSLVGIFNRPELDFSKNRAEGDDILGDAYEYLMRHFATESGKSKRAVLYPGRGFAHLRAPASCENGNTMFSIGPHLSRDNKGITSVLTSRLNDQ